MGKLERDYKKRERIGKLQKIILSTIYVAGIMSVALIAPNVIGAMAKLGILPRGKRHLETIESSKQRLIRGGLLEYEGKGGKLLHLTKEGERRISLYSDRGVLKRPARWDKKWRVVIYDLHEKRKNTRDKLRITLSEFGFIKLQDSVWVYPYDCEDLITLIKADFMIGKDLLYLIVDSIENDIELRKVFKLN